MNLPHNKKPGAIRIQQSFTRPAQRAGQLKPPVAQLKNASTVRQPVAPPVYRPQAKSNVMQQKTAGPHLVKTHPSAPPVYRPQPMPKALQAKMVGNQHPHQNQIEHRVVAPPVYRPQHKKIVQPKMGTSAQTRMPAKTTPVHVQASPRPAQQTPVRPGSLKTVEIRGATVNRGTSIQPSMRTNAPPHTRFQRQMGVAQPKQNPGGGRHFQQGVKVIQAKWVPFSDGVEQWDAPLDGVTWFADDKGEMWFEVTHEDQIKKGNKQNYLSMAGKGKKQDWNAWVQSGAPLHDEVSVMTDLMEANLEWGPASYERMPPQLQRPFFKWLFQNQDEPKEMNCWESVLYAACKAGIKDKNYIKKAIKIKKASEEFTFDAIAFVRAILKAPARQIKKLPQQDMVALPDEAIPRGHVVLFGEDGQHVALSTGTLDNGEHGVLELDKKTGGVVRATVEDVMRRNSAYRSLVTWGPFPAL